MKYWNFKYIGVKYLVAVNCICQRWRYSKLFKYYSKKIFNIFRIIKNKIWPKHNNLMSILTIFTIIKKLYNTIIMLLFITISIVTMSLIFFFLILFIHWSVVCRYKDKSNWHMWNKIKRTLRMTERTPNTTPCFCDKSFKQLCYNGGICRPWCVRFVLLCKCFQWTWAFLH